MNGRGAAIYLHGGERTARLLRIATLVLCAAAVAPPGAGAQSQRGDEPTAEHLWKAYPLDDGTPPPVPTRSATPASAPARDRSAEPAPEDDGGGDGVALPALLAVAAVAAGGATLLRRRARARPGPAAPPADAPAGPQRRVPPAPPVPLLPREARMTPTGRFRRPPSSPRPPEPLSPWEADVRWEEQAGSGRFRAVACSPDGEEAELLRSDPIAWPPSAGGAKALAEAVDAIEETLLEAGWQPRPKGEAWYARRYAWAPEPPPAPAARPAPATTAVTAPPEVARAPRRRAPSPAAADPWTDVALQLAAEPAVAMEDAGTRWSCRIRWRSGWRTSRFEAIAMPPGRKRGPCIAASPAFSWTFKADPDPELPAIRAAVAGLRSELLAAGWAPAGIGRQWYAHRFAWTRDEGPPETATDTGGPAR